MAPQTEEEKLLQGQALIPEEPEIVERQAPTVPTVEAPVQDFIKPTEDELFVAETKPEVQVEQPEAVAFESTIEPGEELDERSQIAFQEVDIREDLTEKQKEQVKKQVVIDQRKRALDIKEQEEAVK